MTLYVDTGGAAGYLHSRYNPKAELDRWWAEQEPELKSGAILIGMGLGYPLQKLRNHLDSEGMLLVIEPSLEIFRCALQTLDLREELADPRIAFSVEESLSHSGIKAERILSDLFYDVSVLVWPAYRRIFASFCNDMEARILEEANDIRMDQRTLLLFSHDWTRNFIYNLPALVKRPGINLLFDQFVKQPIIIVSAGPSLNKNVHLLHQAKEKAVIICVDTALRVLLKQGILPDLVVALDGSEKNYQHFAGIEERGIPLVIFPTTHYKIVAEYGGNGFSVAGSTEYVIHEFLECVEAKGGVSYGGSVATAAFDLACRMGGDPIVFIGQDLAYPDGRSHAAGTIFENIQKEFDASKGMKFVEGIDGRPVLTDRPLDYFRRWFEDQIELRRGERKFIDATEGGAKIRGTEISTLSQVVETYCQKSIGVSEKIAQILHSYQPPDLTQLRSRLKKSIRNLYQLGRLSRMAIEYNSRLREVYQVRKIKPKKASVYVEKLDRIDKLIQTLNQSRLIDLLLQQVLLVVTKGKLSEEPPGENQIQKAIRVTENGRILYSGIWEASRRVRDYLEKALNELADEGEEFR
ncbi:motility associated factor glycosyltransferase family protein [Effusibacillus pohliae]|uniref:motility associated factor glycosyltransferase family protein n=1 Tax=Effusibacillus pohliae TaxID=232270 RepID=UPI0003A7DD7A|nr:6-hydroxymethylpterin diphosphokinase MptE-like protein [Effusibacillus pohliae]